MLFAGTVPVNAMASSYPYTSAVGVDYDVAGVDTSDDAENFKDYMERIGFDYILEKKLDMMIGLMQTNIMIDTY